MAMNIPFRRQKARTRRGGSNNSCALDKTMFRFLKTVSMDVAGQEKVWAAISSRHCHWSGLDSITRPDVASMRWRRGGGPLLTDVALMQKKKLLPRGVSNFPPANPHKLNDHHHRAPFLDWISQKIWRHRTLSMAMLNRQAATSCHSTKTFMRAIIRCSLPRAAAR